MSLVGWLCLMTLNIKSGSKWTLYIGYDSDRNAEIIPTGKVM